MQINRNESLNNKVDICLLNGFVNHILDVSKTDKEQFYNELRANNIFALSLDAENNFEQQYNISYPGELLERYEDRIGTDERGVRALAIALGYTREILTSDLFIGNQLTDFIQMVESMKESDIYLYIAMNMYHGLTEWKQDPILLEFYFDEIEDLAYVISSISNFEKPFNHFKENLNHLLGKKRTISVEENLQIFSWLAENMEPLVIKSTKRDDILLKAICRISTKYVKNTDNIYKTLSNHGYSEEDISLLNVGMIITEQQKGDESRVSAISLERIWLHLCEVYLGSEKTLSKWMYGLLKEYLSAERLMVKVDGCEQKYDVLQYSVMINNPDTYIFLYELYKNKRYAYRLFKIDITDSKWNRIFEMTSYEIGCQIFDMLIERACYIEDTESVIHNCIEKFNQFYKMSYLDSFQIHKYNRQNLFIHLVQKGFIDLISFYRKENSSKYIKDYLEGKMDQYNFEFVKWYIKKYSVKQLHIELEHNLSNEFFQRQRGCYVDGAWCEIYSLDIENDFLTSDDKQLLLSWMEEEIFLFYPNKYYGFIEVILLNEDIRNLYPFEERKLLYQVLNKNRTKKDKTTWREIEDIYLSEKEKEKRDITEQEKMEEEKKEHAKIQFLDAAKTVKNAFNGTIGSLLSATNYGNINYISEICNLILSELLKNVDGIQILEDRKESKHYVSLMNVLYENDVIETMELIQHINRLEVIE